MYLNISNLLTISRIFFTPFIVKNILSGNWHVSITLFLFAAFTDILDGFLARILNQESYIGTLLDPLADKILLISCYISLLFIENNLFLIPSWFTVIIIFKELILISGSLILNCVYRINFKIKPSVLGKLNTFFQILFVIFILSSIILKIDSDILNNIFYIFLYFITVLNLLTLMHYSFQAFKEFTV